MVRAGAVMVRVFAVLVGVMLAIAEPIPPASAQDRTPLLIEGTTTLYQRVLTRPGAVMHSVAGDAATAAPSEVPPLSLFFVYERRDVGGEQWLEIGAGTAGVIDGWIPASTAIDWRQTLVLAFTNPVNRDRALFFRDGDYLLNLIESESLVAETDQIREELNTGTLPTD